MSEVWLHRALNQIIHCLALLSNDPRQCKEFLQVYRDFRTLCSFCRRPFDYFQNVVVGRAGDGDNIKEIPLEPKLPNLEDPRKIKQ